VQLHVTALHAACVAKQGKGVLLCAKSGTGKSVLALACARNGWTFVTDDVAFLMRGRPGRLVLGKPDWIRFKPSAGELHRELNGRKPICDSAGQTVIEARTKDLRLPATAHSCDVDYVVFLNRHAPQGAGYQPVEADEAVVRLIQDMPMYEPRVSEAHQQSVRQLVEARAFELYYSTLEEGVSALERLIETGE
jgi:hypothetical protein